MFLPSTRRYWTKSKPLVNFHNGCIGGSVLSGNLGNVSSFSPQHLERIRFKPAAQTNAAVRTDYCRVFEARSCSVVWRNPDFSEPNDLVIGCERGSYADLATAIRDRTLEIPYACRCPCLVKSCVVRRVMTRGVHVAVIAFVVVLVLGTVLSRVHVEET